MIFSYYNTFCVNAKDIFTDISAEDSFPAGDTICERVIQMEVKTFAATLGLGMAAGAAAMLMIPKQSKVYKAADNAATKLKEEVTETVQSMMKK